MIKSVEGARVTEGDVENKVVWPFLTGPDFLNIPASAIASKRYLPARDLGKGNSLIRGYTPDYIVYSNKLPIMIVEAKAPDEPVSKGYREARLYASEINSTYPEGINPIRFLLAANGTTIQFGSVDAEPSVEWTTPEALVPGIESNAIANRASWAALQEAGGLVAADYERQRYYTAVYYFGGEARLNTRLGPNSLSEALAPVVRKYFDTESPEEKKEILEKAYVDSELTTRYARTFETFLRDRALPRAIPAAKELAPGRRSETAFSAALTDYSARLPDSGSIQILVGSVGAGKTSFVERFEQYLLPDEVRQSIFWVYVNFNDGDPSRYQDWLCEQFCIAFRARFFSSDPSIQLAVFADKKRDFDYANFLIKDSDPHEYNRRLSIELSDWQKDYRIFASSACRYLIGDRRIGVVCVFDNTDKRTRDQQLQIFEVAQWFKNETRSCCVVSLRDETYEQYKDEPPLDTFIHSNHFFIRPPRFIDMIRRRLQLALESIEGSPLVASVSGLGRVAIPTSRAAGFLDSIFKHLFLNPQRKISWVAEGLSGKDARSALRLFAQLIYSPHLDERHLIRAAEGEAGWFIPEHLILNAMMKTDYLFFAENHGFVSNLFNFDSDTSTSDNFIRLEILLFLVERRKVRGDAGVEGYFHASTICERLRTMGYSPRDVLVELTWAAKRGLILVDHFSDRPIVESDIVKAHAAAFVHTHILMNRFEYIANCALTTKVFDKSVAEKIAELWNIVRPATDISIQKKKQTVQLLRDYLSVSAAKRSSLYPLGRDNSLAPAAIERAITAALRFEPRRRMELALEAKA